MAITIAVCLLAWWLVGFISLVYWTLYDQDFTTADIPIHVIGGIMGPLAFVIAWSTSTHPSSYRVIFKKRR